MVGRLFDVCSSAVTLIIVSPLLAAAALGIRLSSQGPVFYRAERVGRFGQPFIMYKLRTMHCRSHAGSSITAASDPRVFPLGRLLRSLKIDELPQLLNVLKGDMAIVGPRPEATDIVRKHYTPIFRESLKVRPGLTSPGSICYYTHGEKLLADGEAEEYYVQRLLPVKMALDMDYLSRSGFISDLGIILQTVWVLLQKALGRKDFPDPPRFAQFFDPQASESSAAVDGSGSAKSDNVQSSTNPLPQKAVA